jgi:hypothetical protein
VILEGRKRREIDPTLAALRECAAQLKGDKDARWRVAFTGRTSCASPPGPCVFHSARWRSC